MENEEPASKRAKVSDSKTECDIEPKPGPSSATTDTEERKRKVPQVKDDAIPLGCYDSKGEQSVPKVESPGTATFFDLDNLCQLMVLDELSVNDLGAMAEVCVKFKEIAQSYFATKYRNFDMAQLVDPGTGKYTLVHVRRLLYNFGHLISSLKINVDLLNERIGLSKMLDMIRKYCMETINELAFENQPGSALGDIQGVSEYIMISFLGTRLMTRVRFQLVF